MRRAPRLAASVAMLVVSGGVALLLVEALAAQRPRPECPSRAAPLWRPDAETGWSLMPGARARVTVCHGKKPVRRHDVVINSEGQRDVPRAADPDVRDRVLVLGDSFVEAVQVPLDRTFTQLLERTTGAAVLNAGVSGYSTDNELRAYGRLARRHDPATVLLVFFVGNDVEENGARLYLIEPHGLPPKPWLRVDDGPPSLRACLAIHRANAAIGSRVPGVLWRWSRATRFLLAGGFQRVLATACAPAAGERLTTSAPEMLGVYGAPRTAAWEEAWQATEARLRRLAADVRANGSRFVVALAPAGLELHPGMRWLQRWHPELRARVWDYDYPYGRLAALLDAEDVEWVDLRSAFRTHFESSGETGYFAWDSHWDETGHAIVADRLRPLLVGGAGAS